MAAERGRGGHCRAHQMRASPGTLSPLKVPVRGRCAALAGFQLIAVECGAERAAGGPPFEAGLDENAVEPLGFRLAPDTFRTGDNPGRKDGTPKLGQAAAARISSIRLLVHDPMKT